MPRVSLTSTELMLLGALKNEQKICTIPHVSPLDHSSSILDILPDFSPSHQNYMRSRGLESEALHKLGGSPPSPIFSPCQPLCVDKTIYLYHFRAGQTGEGLEGTQGGGVREEVMVSLVVKGH